MIVDMGKLSKEELIEMNKKALAQISKLVEENNRLKEIILKGNLNVRVE